ncbi:SDR family oxidoreductase [Bacteroides fragilis]|uniref:SDR family oxidoreductase n=1 Tax=Bacteroides fragilis TaxID=817 RepID=UPI001C700261|nr:SDR family oxidoreductase [Bacteroides fragilis]MBW9278700.1 SDR family NAD(P)-dependent oxidoreductase [Bacteroides fragilis]
MANLFSVKDKVVVITGGTGVLGKTIAVHLAEEDAKVVILGRKAEVGNEIVKTICAKGGEALFLATNVLDRNILEQNLADILKAYGRVDALLNAAGGNMPGATIAPASDIFNLKIDEFQKVVDLNLTGTVLPTQVFLKPMTEQKSGAIVNFSSMAAFRPLTRVAGYSASKAGISNFTAFMATEIAKKFGEGIRINAIAPGFFLTEQNRTLLTNPDGTYTQRGQDVIRQTPFGRMGRAEELCGTIQYLISDAASFVTGTVAIVDGGFNAFAM